MPHAAKLNNKPSKASGRPKKEKAHSSAAGTGTGTTTINASSFTQHLGTVQAVSMMQVWQEERNPDKLTFNETLKMLQTLQGAGSSNSKGGSN